MAAGPTRPAHPHRAAAAEPPALPLAVIGCDFRVASATWRNRLLLSADERESLTGALRASCGAEGLVVLETCNRIEWILAAQQPQWAAEALRAQMVERWVGLAGAPSSLPMPYLYTGRNAVLHLLRVAVGLESFVVGEREIAGQLNRAVVAARGRGQASPLHNALQTAVGRVVKKIQRLPHWRHPGRGVHGLAYDAIRQHCPSTDGTRREVAVVGMGEIGRKTAGLLASAGGYRVRLLNRTIPPAKKGEWLPLTEHLTDIVRTVDAVVVATGAQSAIVDLSGLSAYRRKPLVVVDLGAPAQVRTPPGEPVLYFGLDELLATPAVAPEPMELQAVHELVEEGVREFLVECNKRELSGLLRATHDAYERVSYEQLPAALEAELGDALDPDRRRRLHGAMRDLFRDYTRGLVQEIEAIAESRSRHPKAER